MILIVQKQLLPLQNEKIGTKIKKDHLAAVQKKKQGVAIGKENLLPPPPLKQIMQMFVKLEDEYKRILHWKSLALF